MELFESLVPVGIVLLCLAGVVALVALAYLLVTLAKGMKETLGKVNPLLDDVKEITESAKPIVEGVDPLMDRITLTVDAANLEIMRVDQILEDVNTITGNVAKASNSFDAAASLPLDLVSSAASKIRDRISPLTYGEDSSKVAAAARTVDAGLGCVENKVEQAQAASAAKKAASDVAASERDERQDRANGAASSLKGGVFSQIETDTVS